MARRGQYLARSRPLLYPLLFLLVAYSLSVGNAGTGFRYRTHLVTLGIGIMAILREQVVLARAKSPAETLPDRAIDTTAVRPTVPSPV